MTRWTITGRSEKYKEAIKELNIAIFHRLSSCFSLTWRMQSVGTLGGSTNDFTQSTIRVIGPLVSISLIIAFLKKELPQIMRCDGDTMCKMTAFFLSS